MIPPLNTIAGPIGVVNDITSEVIPKPNPTKPPAKPNLEA